MDPSHPDQVVARCTGYAPGDVARVVEASAKRAQEWACAPFDQRIGVLRRTADVLRRSRWETAAWEVFEQGKPWREADADVAEAIDFLEYYAAEMGRLERPERLGRYPGEQNDVIWSPRGLTAVIAPWNFPLAIPTGMVAAALVTGNAVLFKPSERSSAIGYRLTEAFREAGLPDGILRYLPGGPDLGRALVTSPAVATIAFTGSKDAGRWILQTAMMPQPNERVIKRVIAEMGGKNAIIVDETADLDEAVVGVVSSFTGYAGQKCSACSRAIVVEAVYDAFTERLVEAVHSLRMGPAGDPGTQVGPLIDARAQARVLEYVEVGRREGRVLVDRSREGKGCAVGPVVFGDIMPAHRLAQEEIFGPVLSVMRAQSIDEAIALANNTVYALTGGIYSRSPRVLDMARKTFDVGNLYLNRPITGALVGRQPFGGHRLSGVGTKAGGEDYLKQFMVPRVVSENTLRRGFDVNLLQLLRDLGNAGAVFFQGGQFLPLDIFHQPDAACKPRRHHIGPYRGSPTGGQSDS
jgi:RHH-type proline utilization regulon transcriptional repressor/proline dehydrogenase/delta 1-pyrroline-5-carboxylate dehydrogenase